MYRAHANGMRVALFGRLRRQREGCTQGLGGCSAQYDSPPASSAWTDRTLACYRCRGRRSVGAHVCVRAHACGSVRQRAAASAAACG
eukprot:scaffold38258_cov67-Phaeocystis_antarctica.AAC.13